MVGLIISIILMFLIWLLCIWNVRVDNNNKHKKRVKEENVELITKETIVSYIMFRTFIVLLISIIIGFIFIFILKITGHWISGMGYFVLFSVPLIFVSFISSAIFEAFPPDENSKLFRDLEQKSINEFNQWKEEVGVNDTIGGFNKKNKKEV